jgi:large subunit ribosomal protein L23
MIKPIFTEKSLSEAKNGKYSFWVGMNDTKTTIKSEVARIFGVRVISINTVLGKSEARRNVKGRKYSTKASKKAVVTVKSGEKIDIFEESKK